MTLLYDRWEIIRERAEGGRRCMDAVDPSAPSVPVVLREYAWDCADEDALIRVLMLRCALSWTQSPGLCMPRDVLVGDDRLLVVELPGRGRALLELAQDPSSCTLYQLIGWVSTVCGLVADVHRSGRVLGRLGPDNVVVSEEGLVQLRGFHFDDALRLDFLALPKGAEWTPRREPEHSPRTDVWCLGRLLLEVMNRRMEATRDVRVAPQLRRIARVATYKLPTRRYKTAEQMKARLDEVLRACGSELMTVEPLDRRFDFHRFGLLSLGVFLVAATVFATFSVKSAWDEAVWRPWGGAVATPISWVQGVVVPHGVIAEPMTGQRVSAYTVVVEEEVRRRVKDGPLTWGTQRTRVEALRESRSAPFDVRTDDGTLVRVEGAASVADSSYGEVVWTSQDGRPQPLRLGGVALARGNRAGDVVGRMRVRRSHVEAGDRVQVGGVRDGNRLSGAVLIWNGSTADWYVSLMRAAAWPIGWAGAGLLACGLWLAYWRGRGIRREKMDVNDGTSTARSDARRSPAVHGARAHQPVVERSAGAGQGAAARDGSGGGDAGGGACLHPAAEPGRDGGAGDDVGDAPESSGDV